MRYWELANRDAVKPVLVSLAQILDTPPGAKPQLDTLGGPEEVRLLPGDVVQFCADFHNEPDVNRRLQPFASAAGVAVGKTGLCLYAVEPPPNSVPDDAPDETEPPPFDPDTVVEPHEGF